MVAIDQPHITIPLAARYRNMTPVRRGYSPDQRRACFVEDNVRGAIQINKKQIDSQHIRTADEYAAVIRSPIEGIEASVAVDIQQASRSGRERDEPKFIAATLYHCDVLAVG